MPFCTVGRIYADESLFGAEEDAIAAAEPQFKFPPTGTTEKYCYLLQTPSRVCIQVPSGRYYSSTKAHLYAVYVCVCVTAPSVYA